MKSIYKWLFISLFMTIAAGSIANTKLPSTYNPFPDTIFSKAHSYILDAGAGYLTYKWNTGDTLEQITINQTGWYGITVNDGTNTYQDTVFVSFLGGTIFPRDSVLKPNQTITLTIDTTTHKTVPLVYAVGNFNNWDPTQGEPLASIQNNGYYETYIDAPVASFQLKFTSAMDWNHTVYGLGATIGTLSTSLTAPNINFSPSVAGVYKIGCNTTNLTYDTMLINSFGVVGDAALGWGTDIPLQYDHNTRLWTGNVSLNTGYIKFRANGAWLVNYGALNTDSTLVSYGPNIMIPQAGYYAVTLNFNDSKHFVYHLVNIGNPQLLYPTILWSTGDTTAAISVTPNVTTKYWVRISNGYSTVTDTVTLYVPAYIAGNVVTPKGDMLVNADFYLQGNGYVKSDTAVSDSSGNFTMNIMTGDTYTIRGHKDNDINKANGVTALDLALIQAHILGKNLFNSPLKIIAADVTGDSKVTALDLVYIKRLILGIDSTFTNAKTGEKRLWTIIGANPVFADSSNPFPIQDSGVLTNVSNILLSINVLGIKLGDVNWDWNPLLARIPDRVFVNPKKKVENIIDKNQ